MTSTPGVTVVTVTYGSRPELERCVASLDRQGMASALVVVDNGPDDGTEAWLAGSRPEARYVRANGNLGYGGGVNLGLRYVASDYVLILNPDTVLRPDALRALVRCAAGAPDALLTAKLLLPDGRLNARGNAMHVTGITACRDLGAEDGFSGCSSVPLLSGAAIFGRRSQILELGGFDEDFFMYLEDADLSLRARMAGLRLLCADDAGIVHDYSLAMTGRKFYLLERNRLLMLLKVLDARTLLGLLPALLLTELATWTYALAKGPTFLAARVRGYAWLWRHRQEIARKRAAVLRSSGVAPRTLLGAASTRLPLVQLLGSMRGARALEAVTGVAYRVLSIGIVPSGAGRG